MTTDAYIAGLPKVELHLHIEGSFEPALMFDIAKRNGIALPYDSVEALQAAYNFKDLQSFLDLYYQGMNVLQTEQDYFDLTWAYLSKMAAENVQHVEIFWDPQGHTERGVAFEVPLRGIKAALVQAKAELGISHQLIMSFLRHLSEEQGFATLEQALPHRDAFIGIGLDSSEVGNPPEKFERLFDRCRAEGFKLMAHAGEEGPPEYVRGAIDILKVDRIDHGNHCLDDPELARRVADLGLCLTVCPQSNMRLKNCLDIAQHPIRSMLDLGIAACVNSDDPAYFGGYMNQNYQLIQDGLGLSRAEIGQLARNGINGSFASPARKAALLANLEAHEAGAA